MGRKRVVRRSPMRRGAPALDAPDETGAPSGTLDSHVYGAATSGIRDDRTVGSGSFRPTTPRARETDAPARWPLAELLRRRRFFAERARAIATVRVPRLRRLATKILRKKKKRDDESSSEGLAYVLFGARASLIR